MGASLLVMVLFKLVADAAEGLNEIGVFRPQLLSQPADVHIDGAGGHVNRVTPDALKQKFRVRIRPAFFIRT